MFSELMHSIWDEFSKLVFRAEIEVQPTGNGSAPATGPTRRPRWTTPAAPPRPSPRRSNRSPSPAAAPVRSTRPPRRRSAATVVETVVKDEHDKVGRNDPCWCGSGKKYKKCHGA